MNKILFLAVALLIITAAACTQTGETSTQQPAGGSAADLMNQILQRGYIIISTDPNYEPQSFLNPEGLRPEETLCPEDTLTATEMQGFDVDVAVEISNRLGVEICFATPDWDLLVAGNWADEWDMSVGSMTAKPPRPDFLDFTRPYYAVDAVIAVSLDSTCNTIDDLAGATLCVGAETTYQDWLNGTLVLDPADIYTQPPASVTAFSLDTDQECALAVDVGRTEFAGYVTARTVVESNLAAGMSVRILGEPVFSEKNRVAFDKSSSLDTTSLRETVDQILKDMQDDGTLATLSLQWFGSDLTQNLGE